MRRAAIVVLGLSLVMSCSGCWDRIELEDVAWVQAIGFDKEPSGFVTATLEMSIPRTLGGAAAAGGIPSQPHHATISLLTRTGIEALDLAGLALGRRVSLVHCIMYVFSEDLARSDLRSLLGAIIRNPQVRGSAFVAVCRGRAEDVLRLLISPLEISPSRFIETIQQQHFNTGLFESVHLADLAQAMESESEQPTCPLIALARDIKSSQSEQKGQSGMGMQQSAGGSSEGGGEAEKAFPATPDVGQRIKIEGLPSWLTSPEGGPTMLEAGELPYIGGSPVTMMGSAVFLGGKLVGDLNGEETRGMLMVKGDFENGMFSIPDPQFPDKIEYSVGVSLSGRNPKVHVRRQGDHVEIDVHISLEMTFISMKTQTDYTDPRNAPLVEKAAADYVKKHLDRAIMRTQKELGGSDVFGFGLYLRRTFWTWPEWQTFAWPATYSHAIIRTSVETHLTRYGLELAPPSIPPSEKIKTKGTQ